jgi:small subunit ribosomal protein S16
VGAQPTEQVAAILKITGDWGKFKGDPDAKSTLKVAEPKAPFEIDASKKSVVKPKAEKKVETPAEEAPAVKADAEAAEAPAADAE